MFALVPPERMKKSLINVLAVVLYGSALMMWPICLVFLRSKGAWKRVRWLFCICLAMQLLFVGLALLPVRILEHGYYWVILMIFVNFIFTILGLIAFGRDLEDGP